MKHWTLSAKESCNVTSGTFQQIPIFTYFFTYFYVFFFFLKSIKVDTTDKAATSVIGWLWTENNVNLSVALVEEGLASVHFSAEKTEYYRSLKSAEDSAKAAKKRIWANYVEEPEAEEVKEEEKDDKVVERKVNHEKVVVTEITSELHFFAQHTDQGAKLETLMSKLRKEFQTSPPLSGAYTPKRNDLCAAQFSEDNEWYRARVEKVQGQNATILYVDYGNKEVSISANFHKFSYQASSLDPFSFQRECLSHKLAILIHLWCHR